MELQAKVRLLPGSSAWNAMAVALLLVFSPMAGAAPCAGFEDVEDTSEFCGNVAWIKNRGVTLGCASGRYCPNEPVIRLGMAAFMNRLGTALTPVHLPVDLAPGAVDLDVAAVVCQTQDYGVNGFPRRAYVDLSFDATADSDVALGAELVISDDAGGSWTPLTAGGVNRAQVVAGRWSGVSAIGFSDLDVGETVRWGVRLGRGGMAGMADLADSRCGLRVLIHDRNG